MQMMIDEFQSRFNVLNETNQRFEFLWGSNLVRLTTEDCVNCVNSLIGFYPEDFDKESFVREIKFLPTALTPFLKQTTLEETTPMDVLNTLTKSGLNSQFHNVVIALQIFLTLPVSVASS